MMTFLPFTQSRGYRTAAFVHRSALFVWLVKTAELIPSSANSLQYWREIFKLIPPALEGINSAVFTAPSPKSPKGLENKRTVSLKALIQREGKRNVP